jgi:hypothetical protein
MNRIAIAPLLLAACLGFVAPLALGLGCGGNAALMGTETGNPPGIDTRRLRLEWSEGGVELIGEAGAVPAGAEVRLRNSRTGESTTGTANADGSIRLSLAGSPADPYEVTVSSGGGQTTEPLSATNGASFDITGYGMMPPDDVASRCEDLELALYESIARTFAEASLECSVDSDCVQTGWGVGCYYQCGESTLAASAEGTTRALAEQAVAPICAGLASCDRQPPSSCPPPELSIAACIDGGCQNRPLSQMSCEELRNQASQRRIAAMENADRACNVDADCALIALGVRCVSNCSFRAAVANSAAAQVQSDVEQIESRFCGVSEAVGCPGPPELPCPPPGLPRAICASGRCEVASAGDPQP